MRKNAKTDYPLHDLLERRWSPRAFSGRPVEPATLGSLFEAARWSASCYNEQPWRFIVATREDADAHRRLSTCLVEANETWAKDAGALVLCVVKRTFTLNGNPNRCSWHDLGAATAQLTFQAMSSGLYVHPMAGILADKARDVYGIPEDFEPVTILAIGYLGDPNKLPDSIKTQEIAPRERKPLMELVFADGWERPAQLS
uniref:Nitroreductase n=1 Tax=Candidatus Kentrum sp. FM TaxID=2126340 RepID=A0A450WSN3_9GAMM|nr:MAG: Nitroreductase [Candidatus Kentron sp. FM]VFJ70222.1 MAG: Nitroreductase [Candidatus Kentron sp. FM]VFK20042.1 MAG: Nitroreductase [Candidatus Kentron sp. FM]